MAKAFWARFLSVPRRSIALAGILVFGLSAVFLKNIFFAAFLALFVVLIVWDYWVLTGQIKQERLHEQLIEFLMNMIIMLRAGRTVREVFVESDPDLKEPLKSLVRELVKKIQLKSSLEEALEGFSDSSKSAEARLFVTALKIHHQIGGDLVDVLNNIIETLKNSLELRSRMKTATIQSRFTGNIISFFPVIVFFGLLFFAKGRLDEYFSSALGNIIIITGSFLEILGIGMMKKIMNEDGI